MMTKTRTVNEYYKHLKATKERPDDDDNAYYECYKLSRSALEKIMDACPAGVRKSMLGMDNYSFLGVEAIDQSTTLLDKALEKFNIRRDWAKNKKADLLEAKSYIKTDFRVHLRKISHVAKHCISWALSDPNNQFFQHHADDHVHDCKCPHCFSVQDTIREIKGELASLAWAADELSEVIYLLDRCDVDIQKWIQESVKEQILLNLKPKVQVFITIDW